MADTQRMPPTVEEAQAALDSIASAERSQEAAAALRALCEAVIRAVTAVDRTYNVGAYLRRLELVVHGEGDFDLRIDDQNTGIDPQAVARDVAAAIAADGGDYGKALRPIQLELRGGLCQTVS